MPTSGEGREPAARSRKRSKRGPSRRHSRHRTSPLTLRLAQETARLPEPVQAGVIVMLRTLIRWVRRIWRELAEGGPGLSPEDTREEHPR